jgi:hypothetical protein
MNVVITTVFVKKPYKGCEIFSKNGEQKWVYKLKAIGIVQTFGGWSREKHDTALPDHEKGGTP